METLGYLMGGMPSEYFALVPAVEISAASSEEKLAPLKPWNVAVHGLNNSGKTTLMKQLNIHYGNKYDAKKDGKQLTVELYELVISNMKSAIKKRLPTGQTLNEYEQETAIVLKDTAPMVRRKLLKATKKAFTELSKGSGFEDFIKTDLSIDDYARELFTVEQIDRIFGDDFIPKDDDFIRYVPRNIEVPQFVKNNIQFNFFKVKDESDHKWRHKGNYNILLIVDVNDDNLERSFKYFEYICAEYPSNHIHVFLNKRALLEKRSKSYEGFGYQAGNETLLDYILTKFKKSVEGRNNVSFEYTDLVEKDEIRETLHRLIERLSNVAASP